MDSITSFTLPPLQCSFRCRLHPDASDLEAAVNAWYMSRFNCSPDSERGKLFVQSRYPLLPCLAYTFTPRDLMTAVVEHIVWLFLLDDCMDDVEVGMGGDSDAVETLIGCVMSVLNAHDLPSSPDPVLRTAMQVTWDWWSEMRLHMPPTQRSRFVQGVKDYLDAAREQVMLRQADTILDPHTFIVKRRRASAVVPSLVLTEYCCQLELDEETLNHPLISELHDAVCDHIAMVNDAWSFKREHLKGDHQNLLASMWANSCTAARRDFQEVVLKVCDLIKQRDEDCVRLMAEIKKSKLVEDKPGLHRYLDGLGDWLAANHYWSSVTARYIGVDAHQPSPTNVPIEFVIHE